VVSLPLVILRLALALVLGGVIGLEREFSEHRAGMRTIALVSLGSALFTYLSAYGFLSLLSINHVQIDPTRVASYIVAGIGFLGAGTIVVRKDGARGLTTAAAIWTVAAIGMSCGMGLYGEAVSATLLALLVLKVLHFLEIRWVPHQSQITLQVRLDSNHGTGPLLGQIYDICVGQGLIVEMMHTQKNESEERLEFQCRLSDVDAALRVLDELRALERVHEVNLHGQELDRLVGKPHDSKTPPNK
jgi:putative Mg2+ transporter-C (MgtC) family protein